MLEEKIINDYISILNNLERGKKSNLDDLINSIKDKKADITIIPAVGGTAPTVSNLLIVKLS